MQQASLQLDNVTLPQPHAGLGLSRHPTRHQNGPQSLPYAGDPALAAGGTTDTEDAESTGFDIGWDHAHHGLVPPAELLLQGSPVAQGWSAGKAVYGRRTLAHNHHTRQWLQLRLLAWRQGVLFDAQQVTPNYLAQIQASHCPVTRQPLLGLADNDTTLVVERLSPQAGYTPGNLAVMSLAAARLRAGVTVLDAQRRARALELEPDGAGAAALWWRLAALQSYATPLAFAQAARQPLAVMPPNRVRLLNAVQGLQALLTRSFMSPGWAKRCQALARSLPAHSLRLDFNLFVGAMAPRVLEASPEPHLLRRALEDAWLLERVQRRWQHLVLNLGENGVQALLDRASAAGLARVHILNHEPSVQPRLDCNAVAVLPIGKPSTTALPFMV